MVTPSAMTISSAMYVAAIDEDATAMAMMMTVMTTQMAMATSPAVTMPTTMLPANDATVKVINNDTCNYVHVVSCLLYKGSCIKDVRTKEGEGSDRCGQMRTQGLGSQRPFRRPQKQLTLSLVNCCSLLVC